MNSITASFIKFSLVRVVILLIFLFPVTIKLVAQQKDYPIKPVPFTQVKLTDKFWEPRIKLNHEVTIPIAIQKCLETGRIDNFIIAARLKPGKFCTQYPFDDSDVYKILEGASYSLMIFPDPKLEKIVDSLIYYIGKAQEPDGYLYTNRTIDPVHTHPWAGHERWVNDPTNSSHELYNIGHLYEAAVAHYMATGKRTLLDIAIKSANLVDHDFGPGKLSYYPGHQVIEMGLVKLYRVTGEKRYLDLAKFFLDCRKGGEEYNQAHKPVIEQDKIVGHAVRATYMYSGMADVAALTGEHAYANALYKIWNDLISTKYYITGGIGSSGSNEGFGAPYELPNMSAYCETCASIGLVFWNYRMFLLTGDSKYYDVLERTLYNGLLSGVSLSGDHFFYPNVLESSGQHERSEWFGCACCPGNICRFLPSISGYIYAVMENNIYVNLYMKNEASLSVNNDLVKINQETDYPLSGKVSITVQSSKPTELSFKLRIPSWASDTLLPGDLYHFSGKGTSHLSILVNNIPASYKIEKGYAMIRRTWKPGDKIELSLPMPVRTILANPAVKADVNRFALERGPLMYCLEWPDNKDNKVLNIVANKDSKYTVKFEPNLLNGVYSITGTGTSTRRTGKGIESTGEVSFKAIPYYAWANRGSGEMEVWIADKKEASRPLPMKTIGSSSKLSASIPTRDLRSLNDQDLPDNSNDHTVSYYHWWPKKDTTLWVEYSFDHPYTISQSSVYWFDDEPSGGCRIPAAWKLFYKSMDKWIPVKNSTTYSTDKDKLNTVSFVPVQTTGLRLEVTSQKEFSGGIYEWSVK